MEIRECRAEDVALLEEALPSPGLSRFHENRYHRQIQGKGTYLVAWSHEGVLPAGSGEIRWDGCGAAEVQAAFPGCPELSGLAVRAELQGRGLGTALIRTAEGLVARRGIDRLGMGVDDTNPRAAALYLRLGYEETGVRYLDRYAVVDDEGARHEIADPCRFLVTSPAGRP
ncbi:GNAT family N-acetyltransferase [Paractinoplanes lichenicola]|uniref:GNAT family N-acetyltransferase n=1 Tax=Paractinoplanes lichenicola TaxID=2802976 RepID=A0ABS1VT83_9ACTN|nr:GNAT family N-acetyltransferase [Actinoplanes lichenicola]MBL7257681.1 GNAT family N-acetyltransferase [Actinoplanes lichenicola]